MSSKTGVTKNQKMALIVIVVIWFGGYIYLEDKRMAAEKIDNTRQIQLMNLKGVTHYYWDYGPSVLKGGMPPEPETIPVNNTFSVYCESGRWIRIYYLHEVTPDHYLELEVEVVVIK